MELLQLFSRGSRLSDVPPDFRGMPFWKWRLDTLSQQAERHRAKLKAEGFKPPINDQKVLTPRDLYGMKGMLNY